MKGKTATRKNPSTGSLATVFGPVGGPYSGDPDVISLLRRVTSFQREFQIDSHGEYEV